MVYCNAVDAIYLFSRANRQFIRYTLLASIIGSLWIGARSLFRGRIQWDAGFFSAVYGVNTAAGILESGNLFRGVQNQVKGGLCS